jgi:hypothetical protein
VTACSGIAHLASLADVPIVGLFGPTNPGFTGPFSDKLRVVKLNLPCSPCYGTDFVTGCGNAICMSMLYPEIVFDAVVESLKGKPSPPVPWVDTTDVREPILSWSTGRGLLRKRYLKQSQYCGSTEEQY